MREVLCIPNTMMLTPASTLSDKNSSDKSVETSAWCRKFCPTKCFVRRNILSDENLSYKVFSPFQNQRRWLPGCVCSSSQPQQAFELVGGDLLDCLDVVCCPSLKLFIRTLSGLTQNLRLIDTACFDFSSSKQGLLSVTKRRGRGRDRPPGYIEKGAENENSLFINETTCI